MKAKVIKTGEIVNVIPEQGGWCDTDFKSYSQHYEDKELDFEFQDWSSFRREAAKDFVVALVSSGNGLNPKNIAYSIEMADELIKQLKEK
jgi:hypothetical protein